LISKLHAGFINIDPELCQVLEKYIEDKPHATLIETRKILMSYFPGEIVDRLTSEENYSKKKYRQNTIELYPSFSCNFHCNYCEQRNSMNQFYKKYHKQTMDELTFENSVKKIFLVDTHSDIAFPFYNLIYMGGEPLLHAEFIESTFKKCKTMLIDIGVEEPVHARIITNGSLINDNVLAMIKRNNFNVTVSLDGPESLAGKQRSKYEQTLRGINSLISENIIPRIYCVYTPETVTYLDEIYSFFMNIGIEEVGLIPLFQLGYLPEDLYEGFDKLYDLLLKWTISNKKFHPILKGRLMMILIDKPDWLRKGCKYFYPFASMVLPNGDVFACINNGGKYFYGNVNNDDFSFFESKNYAFLTSDEFRMQNICDGCDYQGVCITWIGKCEAFSNVTVDTCPQKVEIDIIFEKIIPRLDDLELAQDDLREQMQLMMK